MTGWGSPEAVASAAAALDAAATATDSAFSLGRSARADDWSGEASDRFEKSRARLVQTTSELEDAYRSAAGTLHRYAADMRAARTAYSSAAASYESARSAVQANPLDIGAWLNAARAAQSAMSATGDLQAAAARAAAELRAASGLDGDDNPWWDPFGWFTHDPEEPDQGVNKSITDDDAFDPDDVEQGQIGDCFMLSSIVSLLNTDAGDEFIRQNVRWDEGKGGYWVTLYSGGEPKEVFVDKVFGKGARQSDWQWLLFSGDKPSIAALYESALTQEYGYDYLEGGVPADAMEIITGHRVDVIDDGLGDADMATLRQNLDDGGQVLLSSPRSGDHEITVQSVEGSGNTVERTVDIVNTHSYAVTRIEPDGSVWVRNPWGPGNSADGGGEFRVSAEDAQRMFDRASYTNITE